MNLTSEEKDMLNGEHGRLVSEAMRFLFALGDAFEAERMIDISYANTFLGSSSWGKGRLTDELVEEAIRMGVKVRVPSTFNSWGSGAPSTPSTIWDTLKISDETKERILWEEKISAALGIVPTHTCAPYLICDTRACPLGSHISTAESSAIVYFNSVLGIRAERDCIASLFAALTGKYPAYGFHLDGNRHGTIHFDVKTEVSSPLDFSLLGIIAGKRAGNRVPVFSGIDGPNTEDLMGLSAALASSGSVTMFHIEGITPEAPDIATAFGDKKPEEIVTVTRSDFDRMHKKLSHTEGDVNFICLGCPHYSIYEMRNVAELLNGRYVHDSVTLWICTSPAVAMMAEMAGYDDTIRRAGATIMSGPNFCTVFGPGCPGPEYSFSHPEYSVGAIATDAAKQAYYARWNLRAKKVFLGSREQCVDAAVSGQWR